jgi:hypothetical protein
MIGCDNRPIRKSTSDGDFTEEKYRWLLRVAKKSYQFVMYDAIPWNRRFILWRHDLDYSINRAAALAQIEAEEGVSTTYFVNPRSEFYNPFETSQARLIRGILGLGHSLGLHFDAAAHYIQDDDTLSQKLLVERRWLGEAFGVHPHAFSFHNPEARHLQFEAETYGGLVNCYSRRFKAEIPYCSDSNGYWRFRRLQDVLTEAADPCLQVLTHPGWWQKKPMWPRQRIYRCAYGRASSTMSSYDTGLRQHGRLNHEGVTGAFRFLQRLDTRLFEACDYLANTEQFQTLYVELWRLHERQINKLCKAVLCKEWQVPAREVNAFFDSPALAIDGCRLFIGVFGSSWQAASGVSGDAYPDWLRLRNHLVHGRGTEPKQRLEEGCVYLCGIIAALAAWGKTQSIGYDGLAHLGTIGLPACKTADGSLTDRLEELSDEIPKFPTKKWERFKAEMAEVGSGGMAA